MAKLRVNHNRTDRSGFGKLGIRVVLFFLLVCAVFVYVYRSFGKLSTESSASSEPENIEERFFLPSASQGKIIHHAHYSLSYVEKHEQAEWVAYRLTKESLKAPNVKRADKFRPDYDVSSRSAFHKDYTHSGYTRGHMAPAGDMAFSEIAMHESFLMSNMSPQIRELNNGIWRELEENVRDWAYKRGEVIIVTGPLLNDQLTKKIGKNKVSVPEAFYKIILDDEREEAIAFIIPHEKSEKHLNEYRVPIDEIESKSGIDFFNEILPNDVEEKMESKMNNGTWKVDNKRFKNRVQKWNNQ